MRHTTIALLGALALAGCAQLAARYELSDLAQTQIFVADGVIVVGQEPLVARRARDGTAMLSWRIGTSGVRFAKAQPITIDARLKPPPASGTDAAPPVREALRIVPECTRDAAETEIVCTLPATMRAGVYAYTIRVERDGRTIVSDPTFMID